MAAMLKSFELLIKYTMKAALKIQYYFMNKNDYHIQLPTPGSKLIALNPIIPAIKEHKNDLFDWILQEKYINNGFTDQLYDVFLLSSFHGNAHSLIECIDNGINFELASSLSSIRESVEHGFNIYLQLLFSLMERVIKKRSN